MEKKNFIKQMLCFTLLLGIGTHIHAQSDSGFIPTDFQGYYFSPQNLGFATPQTAEFVQYGNTNVNYYNGLLDLDIPLFDYKDTAFELDMSIKYISDGFKPGRRPSMVGNNWILNVGGSITRNVMGEPDDIRQEQKSGLLAAIRDGQFKQYSKEDLLNLNIPHATKNRPYPETEYDMAPDIFDFNFGRHKGRFIIDNNGNAKCISGGGYKIDLSEMTVQDYSTTNAPKSSVIKITTPDGYLYYFGGDVSCLEYSIPNNPSKLRSRPVQITSWYLTSIQDETKNHRITFSYQGRLQKNKYHLFINSYVSGIRWIHYKPDSKGYTKPSESSSVNDINTDHFLMEDKVYAPILKTINTDDVKINFITETFPVNFFGDSDGNDLIYLSSITMTKEPEVIKSCKFDYQISGRYFFLKNVTLYDQSENPAIYSFDYNMSNDLPDPLTTSIDHWGFWNGGYENIDNVDTFLNDGHFEERKAVNTNVASCTMLQRITYPTKGEEAIDYEYNRFRYYQTKRTDSFAWDSNTAAYDTPLSGVRVKNLTLHDPVTGKNRQRSFSYLDPTTGIESGRINELPRYHMPQESMQYVYDSFDHTEIKNLHAYSVSSNCIGRLSNISEYLIGYSDVTETFDDGSFCHYHFSSLADVPDNVELFGCPVRTYGNMTNRSFGYYQILDKALNYAPNDLSAFRGKLLFKKTYDNRYHKVAEEEYHYNVENKTTDYEVSINTNTGAFLASKIFTVPCLLIQEKLTDENEVEILHNYEYNAKGFVTEKETVNSNGDHVYLKYVRPGESFNLPSNIYWDSLISSNRIEEPIGIIKYLKKPQDEKRRMVDFIYAIYEPTNNAGIQKRVLRGANFAKTLPEDIDLTDYSNSMNRFIEAYDNYDKYGNVVTLRGLYDNVTIYLWSYHGKYPIAEIKGSTYDKVKSALGGKPELLSEESEPNMKKMEQLRTLLPHAQITISAYKQQVGLKYISEPSGRISFFRFDDQGRLKQRFRRGDKGALQLMEYNKYHYSK